MSERNADMSLTLWNSLILWIKLIRTRLKNLKIFKKSRTEYTSNYVIEFFSLNFAIVSEFFWNNCGNFEKSAYKVWTNWEYVYVPIRFYRRRSERNCDKIEIAERRLTKLGSHKLSTHINMPLVTNDWFNTMHEKV